MGMDQIVEGLWIGDISSALDANDLRDHNIHSIVSAMRGRLSIQETFSQYQINIDDTEDADVLTHLVSAITFLQKELNKGRGVLVHCHAGISRSATIVAAYIMYARGLNVHDALDLIRKSRPNVEPNDNFLTQLEIFHKASFQVSRHDKATRMFYLERVIKEVMNGDGSIETEMFAKFPPTPTDPSPISLPIPRRRIRCKMCRQELATREHMLDHGQLGPATPATSSRRSSQKNARPNISPLAMSSSSSDNVSGSRTTGLPDRLSQLALDGAVQFGRDLSTTISITEMETAKTSTNNSDKFDSSSAIVDEPVSSNQCVPPTTSAPLAHPSDISAQLFSNPKLAALRSPSTQTPAVARDGTEITASDAARQPPFSPPILADPKCSGYFVEPMKWMEPFLSQGQLAGKILCPNKRCNAKLGNYDWAGVCCSCKEWVVPGFCIHRSKVDEVA